jgi:hypothetical protein
VVLGLAVSDDAATDQTPGQRVDIEKLDLERLPVIQPTGVVGMRAVRTEATVLRPSDSHLAAFLDDEVENLVDVSLTDVVVFDDHSGRDRRCVT